MNVVSSGICHAHIKPRSLARLWDNNRRNAGLKPGAYKTGKSYGVAKAVL